MFRPRQKREGDIKFVGLNLLTNFQVRLKDEEKAGHIGMKEMVLDVKGQGLTQRGTYSNDQAPRGGHAPLPDSCLGGGVKTVGNHRHQTSSLLAHTRQTENLFHH